MVPTYAYKYTFVDLSFKVVNAHKDLLITRKHAKNYHNFPAPAEHS
jgi:hypothetical protein